ALLAAEGLCSFAVSLRALHFPPDPAAAESAQERLAFEGLLAIQLGVLRKRHQRHHAPGIVHQLNGPLLKALGNRLPFALTAAQDRCISEIFRDMAATAPMARLIQGDVGCGKTIVAAHAIAAALDGGYQ